MSASLSSWSRTAELGRPRSLLCWRAGAGGSGLAHYRGSASRIAGPLTGTSQPQVSGGVEGSVIGALTHRCPPAVRRRLGSTAGGSVAVGPTWMPDLSGSDGSEGIWDAAA